MGAYGVPITFPHSWGTIRWRPVKQSAPWETRNRSFWSYMAIETKLDSFFSPKNVAIIGASEAPGSVGRTTLWNLISTPFGGSVFPVNPKRSSVLGIKAYPGILQVPEVVDLAVVVT